MLPEQALYKALRDYANYRHKTLDESPGASAVIPVEGGEQLEVPIINLSIGG